MLATQCSAEIAAPIEALLCNSSGLAQCNTIESVSGDCSCVRLTKTATLALKTSGRERTVTRCSSCAGVEQGYASEQASVNGDPHLVQLRASFRARPQKRVCNASEWVRGPCPVGCAGIAPRHRIAEARHRAVCSHEVETLNKLITVDASIPAVWSSPYVRL